MPRLHSNRETDQRRETHSLVLSPFQREMQCDALVALALAASTADGDAVCISRIDVLILDATPP